MNIVLLLILTFTLLSAASLDDEFDSIQAEFENYSKEQKKEFQDYTKALDAEYASYKKEIENFWQDPTLSSKKRWVSYTKDKKSRSTVDFEKNTVKVETIAKTKNEALQKLQKQLAFSVSADTKKVINEDELQNQVAKLSKLSQTPNAKIDDKPILSQIVFKKKPTQKEAMEYAKKQLENIVVKKTSKGFVYSINVALPKNSALKHSRVYEEEVRKNAIRFNIPLSLVFAIIQTESDFNPFARSHIPAYGLMQIVPWSAGIDAYNLIHKQKKKPSSTYLYNSTNNIEMGSAYLYILYYRYLKKIKDPQSRLYCAIAAYNTGAGNIAWAFTHITNINKAAPVINRLSSEEVYETLLKKLKYDEPKYYLKKVRKRMSAFNKAYASNE